MTFISQRSAHGWARCNDSRVALRGGVCKHHGRRAAATHGAALQLPRPRGSDSVAQEKGYERQVLTWSSNIGGSTLAVQAVGAGRADRHRIAGCAHLRVNGLRRGCCQPPATGRHESHLDGSRRRGPGGQEGRNAQGTAEAACSRRRSPVPASRGGDTDYVESASKCTMVISGQADACTGFAFAQLIRCSSVSTPHSCRSRRSPRRCRGRPSDHRGSCGGDDAVERFLETFRGYADRRGPGNGRRRDEGRQRHGRPAADRVRRVLDLMRSEATDHGWGWWRAGVGQPLNRWSGGFSASPSNRPSSSRTTFFLRTRESGNESSRQPTRETRSSRPDSTSSRRAVPTPAGTDGHLRGVPRALRRIGPSGCGKTPCCAFADAPGDRER